MTIQTGVQVFLLFVILVAVPTVLSAQAEEFRKVEFSTDFGFGWLGDRPSAIFKDFRS